MARLNRFLTLALLAVLSFQLVIASPNVKSGTYKIVSLLDGAHSIGVGHILPAVQPVRIDGSVNIWKVRPEGNNEFTLSVGGYSFTSIGNDIVLATVYEDESVSWSVTYVENQDAYRIEISQSGLGWTVYPDSERPIVEIRPIISTRSLPPQYLPGQLWRFVAIEE